MSLLKCDKLKTHLLLQFHKLPPVSSHYRRENRFLKALIVLAIIGAIFLTCGLSRADAAAEDPPLGAEERETLDEELREKEEEEEEEEEREGSEGSAVNTGRILMGDAAAVEAADEPLEVPNFSCRRRTSRGGLTTEFTKAILT